MMLKKIKEKREIIIIAILAIIILAISQLLTKKQEDELQKSPTPFPLDTTSTIPLQPQDYKNPEYSQPATNANGEVDRSSPEVQAAIANKEKLEKKIPIYIEDFQTTTNLKTTLNIYTIPEDPDYLIHIEIYEIQISDPDILQPENINALAFVDSFNEIKRILLANDVDINDIYFIAGARPYVQDIVDSLIQKYGLLQ